MLQAISGPRALMERSAIFWAVRFELELLFTDF